PDGNQEILGDNDQLVENEEKKKIGAEENTVRATHHKEQPKEELVGTMLDIPGEEHRAHRCDAGNESECQADPVEGEMIIHSEHRHPRKTHDSGEMREIDIAADECSQA